MKRILTKVLKKDPGAKYRLRYIDSEEWTVPVLLSKERMEKFVDDLSLRQCEIILSNGTELTFYP